MITFNNISVRFNTVGASPILKNLCFNINAGERVSLIGHNGSGKSTILRTLAGYITTYTGEVTANRTVMNSLSPAARSTIIGYVQQNTTLGTSGRHNVAENICFTFQNTKWFQRASSRKNIKRALRVLKTFAPSLLEQHKKNADKLSGGQRQLLSLIMVLQKQTPILLLDEITAALDPNAAEYVMHKAFANVSQSQQTIVSVTHNMRHALMYSSRILVLSQGKIAHDLSREKFRKMSEIDLTKMLIESTPTPQKNAYGTP